MSTRALLSIIGVLLIGSLASAGPLDEISHRDKLYDLEIRGDELFVVGYPGLLLHSSDKGASFQALDPGTHDVLYAIDITDNGLGAIVGRSGLVLTTSDGGKTWLRQDSGAKENLFDVVVTAGGNLWAVGHFGTIIHSADGGKTWERQEYDATPPSAGEEGGGTAAISSAEEENEGAAVEARLNAVGFADDQRGWVVGEFGLVLHTRDGGVTWKRQKSASGKLLFALDVVDKDHVIVAGSEGTLMKTSDGGENWQAIETGVSEHILGLCTVGKKTYLVGRDGVILTSEDGGSFKRVPAGLYTWLNAVQFFGPDLGFVVGGRGHLLRTEDGGKTWKRLSGR